MIRALFVVAVAVTCSPAHAQQQTAQQVEGSEAVNKSAPDYVRCRRIAVTGSLARKEKVCKTNEQWSNISRAGNESARETLDRAQSIVNPQ